MTSTLVPWCLLCLAVDRSVTQAKGQPVDSLLCHEHQATLRQVLVDIDTLYAVLRDPETLVAMVDRDTERWVGSRCPTDIRALCVLDPRSRQLDKQDEVSPVRVCRAWAYAVLDSIDVGWWPSPWSAQLPLPHTPDRAPSASLAILLAFLPSIMQSYVVVRFARHMAAVRRQLARHVPSY